MKIFLDTANIAQIKEAASWGVVDGVTTNPTLIAKEGRDFKETIKEISKIVDGPISAEVMSDKAEDMVKEARKLAAWSKNVVVKIPMTAEGLKAVSELKKEGIKTNVTLVFSANQALLAAKAGAAYVSPFVGRLDDNGWDGMSMIWDLVEIFQQYSFDTQIIVASVRHPLHVTEAAQAGAHIATVPFDVLKKMLNHPLTDDGIARFKKDWESAQKKD